MSLLNYIPGVAHVKALTHLICNDKEGAQRTLETFHTKTPIVSHLMAGIAKVAGEDELAEKCWEGGNSSLNALPVVGHVKGLGHYVCGDIEGGNKAMVDATSTTLNMADGIPVVGHTKGVIHYVCGDVEGGNKAMKAATRTTAVMGAGVGGFFVAGPPGAVAGGVGAGAEWDLLVAAVTDGKEANGIAKIIKNPKNVDSYFDAGLSVFGDGLAGYSGGQMAEKLVGPSETAVGGKADSVAARGKAGSAVVSEEANAAAFELAEDYRTGRINWQEYQQKWNDMKPNGPNVDSLGNAVVEKAYVDLTEGRISKAEYFEIKYKSVSNNVPVSAGEANAGQAMKEMTQNGAKSMRVTQYTATNSSGNQPAYQPPHQPQPTRNNQPNTSARVTLLRQRLTRLLEIVRERIIQDQENSHTLDYERELREFRIWQREIFYEIYTVVAELFSNGHSARFDSNNLRLVIASNDGSWSETIEYRVAGQLDVNDQLIHQQFPLNRNSSCPTVLSARFGSDSGLVLSQQGNHADITNVIYGIRCRLCDQNDPYEINPGNNRYINYAGQTGQSGLHTRVCNGHGGCIKRRIDNEGVTEDQQYRPMYEHAANHFRNNELPQGTQPRDAFREVMEVILLPISNDGDLSSWERFWQFFCHCRTSFWGWSQRG
jgi:hypothetical protein